MTNPVLVEITRGETVESRHRGAAVVVDADGKVVARWGDTDRPVYPRSAIKPMQALPLVESGAADAVGLGDAEIALACASHGGESRHVALVRAWLDRLGLAESDLECGPQTPTHAPAADALVRAGRQAGALHNNCSGKHAGFLTLAAHLGAPTRRYVDAGHPTQQAWRRTLAELSGADLEAAPAGIDGCSIPTLALPLPALALAAARFATGADLMPARAAACARIRRAIAADPFLIAGTGRFCTRAIEAGGGRFLVKGGAEGVSIAMLPGPGLGIALKIDDGAGRAADAAMAALLLRYGEPDAKAAAALGLLADEALTNRRGLTVGRARVAGILHSD